MHTDSEQSSYFDRIWAAFIFFTRLPLWRLHEPRRESYQAVVEHWPLTGWLTGGLMAATLYAGSSFLPYMVAVVLAIVVRVLATGALHEDGLADFFDGFGGGGSDRGRVLAIMKDSHIGTYGVLGLILYVMLLALTLFSMPPRVAALTVLAADPFAKMLSSTLITLPYARNEAEAKAKMVYRKIRWSACIGLILQGMLPLGLLLWQMGLGWWPIVASPCLMMYFLYMFIRRRLQGYTGDCCGAVCLLVELTTYLTACVL